MLKDKNIVFLFLIKTAGEKANDLRYKIIENYCIMHSGEKSHIEKALENFVQLENVYVIFVFRIFREGVCLNELWAVIKFFFVIERQLERD